MHTGKKSTEHPTITTITTSNSSINDTNQNYLQIALLSSSPIINNDIKLKENHDEDKNVSFSNSLSKNSQSNENDNSNNNYNTSFPPSPSNSLSNNTTKTLDSTQITKKLESASNLISSPATSSLNKNRAGYTLALGYQSQMHQNIPQISPYTNKYYQHQQAIQSRERQILSLQSHQYHQFASKYQKQHYNHIQANQHMVGNPPPQLTLLSNVGGKSQSLLQHLPIPLQTHSQPTLNHPQQQQHEPTIQTNSQSTILEEERQKRRLERNRIAARQCRERKKVYVANLESKVTRLEDENLYLREQLAELNTRLQYSPMDVQECLRLYMMVEDLKSKLNDENNQNAHIKVNNKSTRVVPSGQIINTHRIMFSYLTQDDIREITDFVQNVKNDYEEFDSNEHLVGQLPFEKHSKIQTNSYAGYIKIRSFETTEGKGNSSLFYWFFPAQEPLVENPPLLIWLQGGPGSSSMIGLFEEHGPFKVTTNYKLELNPYTWNKHYSMLYIDQPVGTGWSYVEPQDLPPPHEHLYHQLNMDNINIIRNPSSSPFSPNNSYLDGYVINQKGVAKDLLIFMKEFYQRYPKQKKSDLYISGESYAGKFIPSFSYAIHHYNKIVREFDSNAILPLKGIAVGSGLTDPVTQIKVHGEHAFQLGLVSREDADYLNYLSGVVIKYIKNNDYVNANRVRVSLFAYYKKVSGDVNMYDVRKKSIQNDWSLMENFLNMKEIKASLNVGDRSFFKDYNVIKYLDDDIMRSVASLFTDLIENYKVLLFQGNCDFRDGVSGNTEWIYKLEFRGAEKFRKLPRKIWKVKDDLKGYAVQYENITRVIVLNAGHLVPMDQPEASYHMITNFIEDKPF
ncbi:16516_t:CDS:10 [Entrophospora sp. SA101]|nr:6599_t:CDS:10 [Entrophospora sp. SA101]CAJ0745895.1 16516_t:CDS:10 [Entrophospora sp. SA101]CAJ0833762.1 11435_t:CDS:10 [Entrophospora sp. SA101]CAJ0837833.1 1101_t:CDS:10 [Entrophospora sp. SA101]